MENQLPACDTIVCTLIPEPPGSIKIAMAPKDIPWGDTPIAKDWLDVPFSLPGGYEQQGKIDADRFL